MDEGSQSIFTTADQAVLYVLQEMLERAAPEQVAAIFERMLSSEGRILAALQVIAQKEAGQCIPRGSGLRDYITSFEHRVADRPNQQAALAKIQKRELKIGVAYRFDGGLPRILEGYDDAEGCVVTSLPGKSGHIHRAASTIRTIQPD